MADNKLNDEPMESVSDILIDKSKEEAESKGPGGYRPGSGRPRGAKNKATLEAMKIRDAFNQRVMQHADDLFNSQLSLATGEQVLMVKIKERDSKGKVTRTYFEQVSNKELIKQYLDYEVLNEGEDPNDDEHFYFLTTKSANNQAIDSMINRALGKVPDKLEVEGGFFQQPELTIKVVGSQHDELIITDDGQVSGDDDAEEQSGADVVGTTEPGDTPS